MLPGTVVAQAHRSPAVRRTLPEGDDSGVVPASRNVGRTSKFSASPAATAHASRIESHTATAEGAMGILRGNRQSGRSTGAPQRLGARPIERLGRDLDDGTLGRCEAQAIVTRTAAPDPYAAWLERREAEQRLRERPEIRWVYRYPPSGRCFRHGGGRRQEGCVRSRSRSRITRGRAGRRRIDAAGPARARTSSPTRPYAAAGLGSRSPPGRDPPHG